MWRGNGKSRLKCYAYSGTTVGIYIMSFKKKVFYHFFFWKKGKYISSGPCRSKYSNSMSEPQMLIQATYPPAYLLIRRLIRCWRTDLSTALKPSFTFSRPPFRAERRGINVAAVINQVMESWNNLLPLLQPRQILPGLAVSDLRKIRRANDKKA